MIENPIWLWPTAHRGAVESRFYLQSANLVARAPYTGQRRVQGTAVQVWVCELTLPPKETAGWRELTAFISRLDGTAGLVRLSDTYRLRPAYDLDIIPGNEAWDDATLFSDGTGFETGVLPSIVSVGLLEARGSDSVVLSSLPVSTQRAMRMGDLFEVQPNGIPSRHGHLYEVVNDANTDAAGATRVSIRPRLRSAVMAGDQVALRAPTSVFRLATDDQGIMQRSLPSFGSLGLQLIEDLPRT